MALLSMRSQSPKAVLKPAPSHEVALDQAHDALHTAIEQGWLAALNFETHESAFLGATRELLEEAAHLLSKMEGLRVANAEATAKRAAEAAAEANGGAR